MRRPVEPLNSCAGLPSKIHPTKIRPIRGRILRDDVLQAWEELHLLQEQKSSTAEGRARQATTESSTDAAAAATSNEDDDDLRAQFMDMVTDAFADVLNQMKDSEEEIDVEVLVDCLQSGFDLMSVQDRELFFQDNNVVNAMEEEEEDADNANDEMHSALDESGPTNNKLTPHEKRRRELGFHIETTA
jgi:Mg2+ and Co2+ transporter CorA